MCPICTEKRSFPQRGAVQKTSFTNHQLGYNFGCVSHHGWTLHSWDAFQKSVSWKVKNTFHNGRIIVYFDVVASKKWAFELTFLKLCTSTLQVIVLFNLLNQFITSRVKSCNYLKDFVNQIQLVQNWVTHFNQNCTYKMYIFSTIKEFCSWNFKSLAGHTHMKSVGKNVASMVS